MHLLFRIYWIYVDVGLTVDLILKVSTVDKYQGQQNDYILLSLVRTKTVGHLRDVRRLIVAMSRARLGLYIFARIPLFANCFELTPAFSIVSIYSKQINLKFSLISKCGF